MVFSLLTCKQELNNDKNDNNEDENKNEIIGKVPSFYHGTWYRIIIYYVTGKGLSTMLEKIIIDETSFTSYGYEHYVSEPEDITYFSDSFDVVFNEELKENEIIFNAKIPNNPNIFPKEFVFRKYNESTTYGEVILLSTTEYDNSGNINLINLSYSKQKPTYVQIPEWAIGGYSTTNISYKSYNMHIDYYPFDPKIFEFIFSDPRTAPNVIIREFRGYTPGTYPVYMEMHYFIEILRGATHKKADKTRFYFDEYFIEREFNSSSMFIGSIDEDNIFFNKVFVTRRNDLVPVRH
jgi:hypothetical protein